MTELKTLKDFNWFALNLHKEFRAQAIRDVKEVRRQQKQVGLLGAGDFQGLSFSSHGLAAIDHYIMWKNNLTEEDLQ